MNQYAWTIRDENHRLRRIAIAHSPASGHLVLHCDGQVVLIEFGVLSEREFSFFIGEEFCRVKLTGSPDKGFRCTLRIDTDAQTPINNRRKVQQQRRQRTNNRVYLLLIIVVIATCAAILYLL